MNVVKMSLAALVFHFFCSNSYTQVINIENARMQSDSLGWDGRFGAGLTMARNIQDIFIFNTAVHVQKKTEKNLWLIFGNSDFLKANKQEFINNSFIHLRFNRKLGPVIRWEVFMQAQNNHITLIDSRLLLGTGPRFRILKEKKIRLYAASLVMFEREKELTSPVVLHNDIRSSSYVSFTLTPKENIEIVSTTFFQPLFKKPDDFRIMNQSSFEIKASRHLTFNMQWNFLYDRFPAGTAPKVNYSFNTGFGYKFRP